MQNSPRWSRLLLAVLLLAGILLGLAFCLVVPVGEKPDEPSHLARVLHLARYGEEPHVYGDEFFPGVVTYEAVQPFVYYRITALVAKAFPDISWTVRPSPLFGCMEGSRHFILEGSHRGDPPILVVVIRLLGLLALLLSSLLVYFCGLYLFGDARLALLVLTLHFLIPQILFISTSVSNDGAAILAGGLVMAAAVFVRSSRPFWTAAISGAIAAIMISVKVNLAAYLVTVPVMLVMWRPNKSRRVLSGYLLGVLIVVAAGLLFTGSLAGQELSSWRMRIGSQAAQLVRKDYLAFLSSLLSSYWAQFGWMDIDVAWGVRALWVAILALATIGWSTGTYRAPVPIWPLWIPVVAVVLGWMMTLGSTSQLQGRFLFPYAGPIAILIVRGLAGLRVSRWWVALPLLCGAADVACIMQLQHTYGLSSLPERGEMDAHQCYADRVVLYSLSSGAELGQSFFCRRAGLCAIDVMFEGAQKSGGVVYLEVVQKESGKVFRTAQLPLSSLVKHGYTRFQFAPIAKSAHRGLSFRIRLEKPDSSGDLSLRFALGNPYLEGVRLEDGEPRGGDMRFVIWCKEHHYEEVSLQ